MAANPRNPLRQLTLAELRRRTSMKWRAYPPDVLPLWVAEMDTPLADPVRKALRSAVDIGDTGYPAGSEYAEAFARFASARWNWDGVAIERTAMVADVMNGIVELLKLITDPGDPVVVNCPVYPPFYAFVEHLGREIIEAPLGADGRMDLAELERAFAAARMASGHSAYLLCNPHNPTGTVHTATELRMVAELSAEYGIRVIADEIHGPLCFAGATFVPFLTVAGSESSFCVTSASKAWNLAGAKAALIVAGARADADLARLPEEVSHGPSHLGVIAHIASFAEGGDWLDALLAGLEENRELLKGLVAKYLPGIGFSPPESTYLAWLDCTGLGLPEEVHSERGNVRVLDGPAGAFLEHGRVALNAGIAFGSGGRGHVRLNFAAHPDVLTEAVHRMARTLGSF